MNRKENEQVCISGSKEIVGSGGVDHGRRKHHGQPRSRQDQLPSKADWRRPKRARFGRQCWDWQRKARDLLCIDFVLCKTSIEECKLRITLEDLRSSRCIGKENVNAGELANRGVCLTSPTQQGEPSRDPDCAVRIVFEV